jgi:DNA-binding PadR family transcriptional regulator
MFGRHGHWGRHEGLHGRGPFGFHGHMHGHMHGRRGRRFFDQGDLRFVLLKLIADQPSHGYELIKAIEQAAGGTYSPSPGVIYPTLTLLEELGYVTSTEGGGGKKLYTLTAEGQAFLGSNRAHVDGLEARMAEAAAASAAFSPQILRARENLKTALRIKLASGLTPEQVTGVAQVLDDAARALDQV